MVKGGPRFDDPARSAYEEEIGEHKAARSARDDDRRGELVDVELKHCARGIHRRLRADLQGR